MRSSPRMMMVQASKPSSMATRYVSPIPCPPAEKPVVTLADVLRRGAENDRHSLQTYLHTLAAREKSPTISKSGGSSRSSKKEARNRGMVAKERRIAKRKRNACKSKRSSSADKRKKRSEEDLSTSGSGSLGMSATLMTRGSADLSASSGHDATRATANTSNHHLRSRSVVDFAALCANTAAFDAMHASLDVSTMGLGVDAHRCSHRFASCDLDHHGRFATPSARAGVNFGADISPTSSFCMSEPILLEPAPMASFSVDEQQQRAHFHTHQQAVMSQQQQQQQHSMLQPHQQHAGLPYFEDFMSSAFLQAFPEEEVGHFTLPLLLIDPGVAEQQRPSPNVATHPTPGFTIPAPPPYVPQRTALEDHHHQTFLQHNYSHAPQHVPLLPLSPPGFSSSPCALWRR